jgi:hypothetical protein
MPGSRDGHDNAVTEANLRDALVLAERWTIGPEGLRAVHALRSRIIGRSALRAEHRTAERYCEGALAVVRRQTVALSAEISGAAPWAGPAYAITCCGSTTSAEDRTWSASTSWIATCRPWSTGARGAGAAS